MESYCASCKKDNANKRSRVSKAKTNKSINDFIKLCCLCLENIDFY